MMAHFTMAAFPPADEVGVGAGIVYGRPEAQVCSGPGLQSPDLNSLGRLKLRSA
jgi:hypothetical protein